MAVPPTRSHSEVSRRPHPHANHTNLRDPDRLRPHPREMCCARHGPFDSVGSTLQCDTILTTVGRLATLTRSSSLREAKLNAEDAASGHESTELVWELETCRVARTAEVCCGKLCSKAACMVPANYGNKPSYTIHVYAGWEASVPRDIGKGPRAMVGRL